MQLMLNGDILVERLIPAFSIKARMVGLLGRRNLPAGHAMLLKPCSSIHTVGMRFTIDVIFIDNNSVVTKIVPGLKPNRFALGGRGARAAIEMESGRFDLSAIGPGARLKIVAEEASA